MDDYDQITLELIQMKNTSTIVKLNQPDGLHLDRTTTGNKDTMKGVRKKSGPR